MTLQLKQSPAPAPCDLSTRLTKSLLGFGLLAGPVYVAVAAAEALTRPGFDPARHDLSLLANGSYGWVQTTLFIAVGAMTVVAATGMRRALGAGWAPRLVAGYGIGLIGAGLFTADPAYGFPPGTADGKTDPTWHGLGHIVSAGLGFLALIAACILFSRAFRARGRSGWARYASTTAIVFAAAFIGIVSGPGQVATTVAFTFAVIWAWTWLAAVSLHLYRETGR